MVEIMPYKILINDISDLSPAAERLIKENEGRKIFLFYGEMGAGKTTFIKEICKKLDVSDSISSPTYSLVNEYDTNKGIKIYHFDFYRIKNESEAFDLGYEEYFYSGNYCLIEWPEKIQNLIPADCVKVHIASSGNEKRIITIS